MRSFAEWKRTEGYPACEPTPSVGPRARRRHRGLAVETGERVAGVPHPDEPGRGDTLVDGATPSGFGLPAEPTAPTLGA
ncbi:MAG: hypothetical protein ACJ77A_11560 [Actinomycetota bacterium]